jgi:hypothetical protein
LYDPEPLATEVYALVMGDDQQTKQQKQQKQQLVKT